MTLGNNMLQDPATSVYTYIYMNNLEVLTNKVHALYILEAYYLARILLSPRSIEHHIL